jgi:AcrR family transcriptional regulator
MTQSRSEASAKVSPSAGGSGVKGRARGDARKRQILDAALDLFSARGFHAVSVADLANQVGMTQAGLLHHYPTKAALMLAVLQEREDRNNREQQLRLQSGTDYFTALLNTLEENEKKPALVQLFAVLSAESLSTDHPGHDWFVERYEHVVTSTISAIQGLLDESKLPSGTTVETVARWIIGLADGLRIQWLLSPVPISRHEHVRLFIQLLEPYMYSQEPDPPKVLELEVAVKRVSEQQIKHQV